MSDMTLAQALDVAELASPMPSLAAEALRKLRSVLDERTALLKAAQELLDDVSADYWESADSGSNSCPQCSSEEPPHEEYCLLGRVDNLIDLLEKSL